MYLKKIDNTDSTLYNIESLKLDDDKKCFILLNNEKENISYYLKKLCYINLKQFYQKSNLFKKELNFKNINPNIYFDESINDDITKLEIITQGIISSLNKNINCDINKTFNLYLPKSKILKIKKFNGIINKEKEKYLNEYDIYLDNIKEWYEDNINGVGEEELKHRPVSPDNNYNIRFLTLEVFVNKLTNKINNKIAVSKYDFIFEINPLLIIKKEDLCIEWYVSKIIIEDI